MDRIEELENKLRTLRNLATTAVPNCVNLDAIDRVLGEELKAHLSTPPLLPGRARPQLVFHGPAAGATGLNRAYVRKTISMDPNAPITPTQLADIRGYHWFSNLPEELNSEGTNEVTGARLLAKRLANALHAAHQLLYPDAPHS